MDPVSLAVISAGATAVTGVMQYQATNAQAKAQQQAAAVEQQNAIARSKEATAVGQRKALERTREARYAQSRLKATAGASGASSDDPTVMDLWQDIGNEGKYNADQETAAAKSKAQGIKFQGDMNRWTADADAKIMKYGAKTQLIGSLASSVGSASSMRSRYGGYSGSSSSTRAWG